MFEATTALGPEYFAPRSACTRTSRLGIKKLKVKVKGEMIYSST
jgi:hypothetical protein